MTRSYRRSWGKEPPAGNDLGLTGDPAADRLLDGSSRSDVNAD
jgi:hypothetical protein